jgi:hypothetical protein
MIRPTESIQAGWIEDKTRNIARLWNVAGHGDEGYFTGHGGTGQSLGLLGRSQFRRK